jgi:S-adenosylmethionine:tRNA ribosyltransferase-isomerase
MGVKANQNLNWKFNELGLKQWDAYEMNHDLSAVDSLTSLLNWMKKNNLQKLVCKTQIIIIPSYDLKIANGLLTNFHQPNSTLLLLVAAITGDDWRSIYNYALRNDFRFLSYGDGCLII